MRTSAWLLYQHPSPSNDHAWVHHRGRCPIPMRLYHNPRCSKSRQALALLESKGVEVEVHRYLENGIVKDDIALLAGLDGIVRKKDAGREVMASLTSAEDIAALLLAEPKLLERPVLVHEGRAVIGRPPEDILQILS